MAIIQVVGVAVPQTMVGVGVPQQMTVEVGVLQVAVSWVVVVGVGLPQVVVRVALPQVAMAGVPQAELAVGVSQAVAQGTAVAEGVATRQVQCSIETHVLCNASTHHNVWHSMCIIGGKRRRSGVDRRVAAIMSKFDRQTCLRRKRMKLEAEMEERRRVREEEQMMRMQQMFAQQMQQMMLALTGYPPPFTISYL